jgi:VIT1/CCC1 family predicted Fe2+/Mn2+ transporter
MQVAIELTEKDALGAHIRDELGINEISQANPIQAAIASGTAFTVGGILPLWLFFLRQLKEWNIGYMASRLFF